MISKLYLAANYVGLLRGHLQIVGLDGSSLWEVEVQAPEPGGPWEVRGLEPDLRDHTAGPYYGDFGFYGRVEMDLGARDANDVWGILQQAGVDFDAADLTYLFFTQNSNTFAYSMLRCVGIDASSYYTALDADGAWGLSYPGDYDARDLVRFTIDGTSGDDFADVQANALDSASGVVITLAGEGTLTFTGVTLAQLNADDFIFS